MKILSKDLYGIKVNYAHPKKKLLRDFFFILGNGGGIITKKQLFTVLLITSIFLSGIATASAATAGTVQTQNNNSNIINVSVNNQSENVNNVYTSTKTQINVDNSKTEETKLSDSSKNGNSNTTVTSPETNNQVKTENPATDNKPVSDESTDKPATVYNSPQQLAAAGEVNPAFTLDQIKDAAARVKAYIETNKRLPNYVTMGSYQVLMPDFLKLLSAGLLQINSGTTTPVPLKTVGTPAQPSESLTIGNIYKTDYLDLAKRVNAFIDTYNVLPNYANTVLGKIRYENLIYTFSKIVNFQKVNNYMPNYVSVKPWTSIATSIITQARTVYLTSDYINGYTADMNRLNAIANALRAMGLTVINYGIGPNTHYSVLQSSGVPANALIVDIYGGADAGLIYEMGTSYYKKLVASKKVFCVWMPPAVDITGLTWLPRAHDDNYSPSWFTGLANPAQYLLNNGYHYIYSGDLNAIISAIYKDATS